MRALIRADSDPLTGTGHVMRMLAMAQWLHAAGHRATIAATALDAAMERRLQAEGVRVVRGSVTAGSQQDVAWTARCCEDEGADWLITDGYVFADAFQAAIHARGIRQLVVDDYGHCERYVAELVLNQNSYADERPYARRSAHTELLLGTRYVLLRSEFRACSPSPAVDEARARRILVTMGGADPVNATATVSAALAHIPDPELDLKIVVGGANPRQAELRASRTDHRQHILTNVSDMPSLMQWADLAIAGAGTTTWELAFMCVPALLVVLADNQLAVAESMQAQGACVNLGWHHELEPVTLATTIEAVCGDAERRRRMAELGHTSVDGRGGERVLERMGARQRSA